MSSPSSLADQSYEMHSNASCKARGRLNLEKSEILSNFFGALVSAIQLSRLKGSSSNFSNLCSKIEFFTDRRFSYGHLAQLKFILPEVIEVKKVLVLEERTSTMKPDLHISFNSTLVESEGNMRTEIRSMHIKKLFHKRLSEFLSSHPKIDEVPKGLLPEPFNCSSQPSIPSTNMTDVMLFDHLDETPNLRVNAPPKSMFPTRIVIDSCTEEKFVRASHLPHSSGRHFSRKVIRREEEKFELAMKPCTQDSTHSNAESLSKPSSPFKLSPYPTFNSDISENIASPLRFSTPAKDVSTPVSLMVKTHAMPPLKRSYMSPGDDSICSSNKLVRRPPRARSLIFNTSTKKDQNDDNIDDMKSTSLDHDVSDILPDSLLQSIQKKERKAKEEQMPAISRAKRRQEVIASLPSIFNAISFMFHKRTVITKEELIHELLSGLSDIVDRREIEEQLNLLLELVPEWIYEKKASTGDSLLCINKLSNAETVRARLEQAK